MIYKVRSLDPSDIYSSTLVKLVVELFLLTLFIGDDSRVDSHLGVCSCSATLRQSAGIDDEYAVDDLDRSRIREYVPTVRNEEIIP